MFQKMGQKLRYIETHRARPLVDDLCQLIRQQIIRESRNISKGLVEAIQLDTIYGMLRHLNWIQTPIFQELLANHLATQHCLSRKLIDPMVAVCCKRIEQILQISDHGKDANALFLRYLIISSIHMDDVDLNEQDFGLGDQLLTHIQKANDALLHQQPQFSTVRFSQSIDALLSDVILELHERTVSDTSFLCHQKLLYLCKDAADDFASLADDVMIRELYNVLHAMSVQDAWENRHMIQLIDQTCGVLRAHRTAEQILQQMFALQLIFRSSRTRNGKMEKWSLSPLGMTLISDVLAASWLKQNPDAYQEIATQVASVQKSIIQNLRRTEPQSLLPIFESIGAQLSKPAIHELLSALRNELAEHQFLALLFDLVKSSKRPWVRSTVCRIIRRMQTSSGASRILREIVKSESSQQVRDLALSSLMELSTRESNSSQL